LRSPWTPLALLGLLWIGLTCAQGPASETRAAAADTLLLRTACERTLASLLPESAPARRVPVALPSEVGPALRALRATGMGGRVTVLEESLERAARLALSDVRPWLEAATASGPAASSAAFRETHEAELRTQLAEAASRRLSEAGVPAALERVRDGASRLPLRRSVDLDLVSLVTDSAAATFFTALGEEEQRLRQERQANGGG